MAHTDPASLTTAGGEAASAEMPSSVKTNTGGKPAKPLETRHVFLDTQVYRAVRHNPANRVLTLLQEQIEAHKIVLHTTDITLLEVERQIRETIIASSRELGKIEKDLVQWRKASKEYGPSAPVIFSIDCLAEDVFAKFETFIKRSCAATVHAALEIPASVVFASYLRRDPPFNGPESKEFPDGFAFEALSRWCAREKERIYVVTQDGAFLKAAEGHPSMLPMKDLHGVLASAAADLDEEVDSETIADATLDGQDFDGSFVAAMRDQIREVVFVYAGDLAEGEAYQGEFVSIEQIDGWSVVGLSAERITLILEALVTVRVEVQYQDREGAIYVREDDRWFGSESASADVEEEVRLQILVDLERARGRVLNAKVLTPEVTIHGGWTDYEY
ncbi:PIN domain-containing protein [uncultured Brevundimonas sp.]|uniref:PIN domain-containing protein n=1 Tax=uncultured Brevundimonas sp. TaxID=213418 RepID=UPI0025D64CA8|nr:PIN domain-containing protein [uncultured Brevundimonas sp.]